MLLLYQFVIPLLLLFAPWVVVRFVLATEISRRMSYKRSAPYLVAAAGLWFVGCALPKIPLFGGQTETFVLHSIGGVVAVVLFRYVTRAYNLKFGLWWQEPVFLFAFVSSLGVLNELNEFFLHQTGLLADKGADAWWDLVANTLGAILAFAVVLLLRRSRASG